MNRHEAGRPTFIKCQRRCSPSEIDRLLDSVAAFTRRLYTRTADVFMDAADDPAQALHEALDSLLRDLAASPEMTYMSTVELPRLGPLVRDRHHRMLDLFSDFLQPGFAARGVALPNPEIVSLCVTGGLWRIVRQHAIDRRLQELPAACRRSATWCCRRSSGSRRRCG